MSTGAVITAAGMVTALGDTAASTTAAVRARLTRFREWPSYPCLPADPPRPEEPFSVVAAYTDLPRALDLPVRLLALALQDLATSADLARADLEDASFFLARPSPGPSAHHHELRDAFRERLADAAGIDAVTRGLLAPDGHAAMLLGLAHAARAVEADPGTPWIVAGADALVDVGLLEALDHARRLKSRRNLDGFIPGEAAAALLVEHRRRAEARGAPILAEIEGSGVGQEPQTIESGDPPSGAALAAALAAACAAGGPPAWVLCDLNGESYRAKEWGLARVRAPALLGGVRALWHPADGYGDVGAATGGCLAAACVRSFERGAARASPAGRAALFAGSGDGTRAAVCLVSAAAKRA
ncbi:hypothetical protein [Sorangium sp. So ce381]|uniref:hypothetical protein n=1 Tax=Sorangium sp. So ce381 TaxID=3133307 RepID=UPI003F5AF4E5